MCTGRNATPDQAQQAHAGGAERNDLAVGGKAPEAREDRGFAETSLRIELAKEKEAAQELDRRLAAAQAAEAHQTTLIAQVRQENGKLEEEISRLQGEMEKLRRELRWMTNSATWRLRQRLVGNRWVQAIYRALFGQAST